jgi:hypothetical protein
VVGCVHAVAGVVFVIVDGVEEPMQERVLVEVIVSGGVVQDVICGSFVEVTVRDYDCGGCAGGETDDEGEHFHRATFGGARVAS